MTSPPLISASTRIAEVRVNNLAANVVGGLLSILLCALGVFLAHLLPHYQPITVWHVQLLLLCLIVLLPVHEALHAIGLRLFGRLPWSDIKIGFMWRALLPYCHCKVPIPITVYRRMILLPLWGTGGASLLALLLFPSDALGLFLGVAVGACAGDLWIVARLRRFGTDVSIEDSPSEIGCDVLSSHPASEV